MAAKETVPNTSDEKPKKTGYIILCIITIVAVVFNFVFIGNVVNKRRDISLLNDQVMSLKHRRDKQDTFLQEQGRKRLDAETELEKIKKRVENIKTLDDLLERDIKLYIKTNYKKVPRSVAENIASNSMKYGKQYNISPILLVGIMQVESGFNPMITGPKTKYGFARGLMQVMPEWVKKLGVESNYDLYDIDINIETGCKVWLVHLDEEKGSISKALFEYVNGDKKYVDDVFKAMGKFVAFRSTVDSGKDEPINEEKAEKVIEEKETPTFSVTIESKKEVKEQNQ